MGDGQQVGAGKVVRGESRRGNRRYGCRQQETLKRVHGQGDPPPSGHTPLVKGMLNYVTLYSNGNWPAEYTAVIMMS